MAVFAANVASELAWALFLHFPGFLQRLGARETTIGAVIGTAAVASVAVRPWVGRQMDRRGRKAVILAGAVLNLIAISLYLTVETIGPWVFCVRLLHGVATAMSFTAFFTYAADVVPAGRRTEGLAIFGISGMAPIGLGGVLGDAILARTDFTGVILAALVLNAVALALSLPLAGGPVGDGKPTKGFWAALRQRSLSPLWLLTGVFALAMGAVFVFVKTFVLTVGLGSAGSFFAFYASTAIVLRVTAGSLPDRLGPMKVLYPALGVQAAGLLLLAVAAEGWHVGLAGALCGGGHGFVFPILYRLVVDRAPAAERGSAMAAYTALFDVALLAGGPLLGWVIDRFGYPAMFAGCAAVVVIGAGTFAHWDRRVAVAEVAAPP